MAYNNKNYLEKIKQAVEVTKAHYEPGRQDRNHRWVWNNYIYDMFHVGYITYLSGVLPYAIMGMLVVYCLKNMNLFAGTHGIPEILASAAVVGLHVRKRNTLLSIAVGTVFYMFLVQVVF